MQKKVFYFMSLQETNEFAEKLASVLKQGDLLLLTGEIGAGKTAFIQAVALGLGIKERVTSPSFVIHSLYESGRIPLSHVDLYRLNSDEEVENIGFEDYYDSSVTAVEWADRYSGFSPPYLSLHFVNGDGTNERILTVSTEEKDWEERFQALGADDLRIRT